MKEARQPRSRCTLPSESQHIVNGDDEYMSVKGRKRSLQELFHSFSFRPSFVLTIIIVLLLSVACWTGIHRTLTRKTTHWLLKTDNNNNDNKKPYFIIHLGPTKTATTTIQVELTKFQDVLLQEDNYAYVGKYQPGGPGIGIRNRILEIMRNVKCHEKVHQARMGGQPERPDCWKELLQLLAEYQKQGTSIVMSEEGFSFTLANFQDIGKNPIDWVALQEDLGQDWNILAIVAYRRLAEWIPSARQQRDRWGPMRKASTLVKWPPKGNHLQPLFPGILEWPPVSGSKPKRMPWFHYDTDAVLEMIQPHVDVRVLNMYSKESIRTNFFCNMLPNAHKSCQASMEKDKKEGSDTSFNSGQSLYYDALATAAAEKGLLKYYENYTRHDVATTIQVHQERQLNLTVQDFATICPAKNQLEILLQASLNKEAKIMPGLLSEQEHRDTFWKNVAKGKYCWVDVDTVLEMEEWKDFFGHLTPKRAHKMVESITVTNFFGFPIEKTDKNSPHDSSNGKHKERRHSDDAQR